MTIRNLTWQQVVVLVACLAAVLVALKFFGNEAAGVTAVVSTVLTFLLGRDPPAPPTPPTDGAPTLKLVTGGAAAAALMFAVQGCAMLTPGGRYAAEQAACASTAKSIAESRACRQNVDRAWGIGDEDGGAK